MQASSRLLQKVRLKSGLQDTDDYKHSNEFENKQNFGILFALIGLEFTMCFLKYQTLPPQIRSNMK